MEMTLRSPDTAEIVPIGKAGGFFNQMISIHCARLCGTREKHDAKIHVRRSLCCALSWFLSGGAASEGLVAGHGCVRLWSRHSKAGDSCRCDQSQARESVKASGIG